MLKTITENLDFRFYIRFAGLFLLFYCGYTFIHAAATPSGTYYPFVERYLNFPVLIRISVLHTSQFLLQLLGYSTTINDAQIISSNGRNGLEMAWACYGMGVKSFWVAFVCAHSIPLRQKIRWSVVGIIVIFILNCIRVTVMMIAQVDGWTVAEYLGTNAHDLFNYLSYTALLGLILIFYARIKLGGAGPVTPIPKIAKSKSSSVQLAEMQSADHF